MVYIKKADRLKIEEKAKEIVSATKQGPEPIVMPAIRVKHDWSNKDPWRVPDAVVKKYPEMAFHWVLRTIDTVNRMEEYEGNGWTYPQLTREERGLKGPAVSETTFIIKGDTVLMMLPIEDYKDFINHRDGIVIKRQNLLAKRNKLRQDMESHHELGATLEESLDIKQSNQL